MPRGKRRGTKSSAKTSALVTQPHGGALQVGNPGNVGGTGRPPSAIRELLRGSFAQRINTLEQIADGEAVQKIKTAQGLESETKMSADVSDRLKAIDLLAKYGLGTTKEMSVEAVSGKLVETDAILSRELSPDMYERISAQLRDVWNR